MIDSVHDVENLLNHFGVEKFTSIGWSGGGPHCLADTTLAQNMAAISIAGVGPFNTPGLNFLEGMGPENHEEFGAAIQGKDSIEAWMKANSAGTAKVTGPQIIEALGGLIGDADKKALDAKEAESTALTFRHALVESYYGWMDDDLAFVAPWGFELSGIDKPVELWQGDDDLMVPHSHANWLHSKIKGSTLHFIPGEGHISLAKNRKAEIINRALDYLH